MAKRDFLVDIDLNKNQLINAKLQNLATAPTLTANDKGYCYYNTVDSKAYYWTGISWVEIGGGNGITNLSHSKDATSVTIISSTGTNTTIPAADGTNAGVMTAAMYTKLNGIEAGADITDSVNVAAAGAVMKTDYDAYSILAANSDNTPAVLTIALNSVLGRIAGNIQNISIDSDLSSVSASDDTLPSAKATKTYIDNQISGHKHYQLHKPDGTTPFVYTDNSGALHIDGDIIQNGSTYTTHAENVNTTKDTITLRDGAVAGLGAGVFAGIIAKLYDGVNDGRLVFDNTGTARVGDVGAEQALTTRIDTPTNGYIAYWEGANTRLNFKQLTISDISNLSSWTGNAAINTLGTITAGTWNGSIIGSQYGGTGVNNAGRTLAINTNSGTIAFTNASTTLTVANNASVSGTNTGDQTNITGNAGTATALQTARTIAISGDITGTATSFDGSANISISSTLPNIATAGTYKSVTVNAKGQVTAGTNPTTLAGYGITDATRKYAVDITGTGSASSFTVTHNLNTLDIVTFIKEATSSAKVEAEEVVTSANVLTINFNTAPANGKVYRVVVVG